MSDTSEHRLDQWVRLPPAEILAVVPTAPVPEIPPASLGDLLQPVHLGRRIVGWHLDIDAVRRPESIADFWAWRRLWSSSFAMGPITNVRALAGVATAAGHAIGAELSETLRRICAADVGDEVLTVDQTLPIPEQLDALARALARAAPDAGAGGAPIPTMRLGGLAMFDATKRVTNPPILRTWPIATAETVLAAGSDIVVLARGTDGLVVVHGEQKLSAFREVSEVDLCGEVVLVHNAAGDELQLTPAQARPLAWLAPNCLRWSVRDLHLVNVWSPLLMGLPRAIATAERAGSEIRFTSQIANA